MASILVWLQANWMQLLMAALAIDTVLVGIFPSQPIFGSIAGWIRALMGSQPPQLK